MLLTFDGYNIQIQPEALQIKPFKAIFLRDKSKDKQNAYQELSYIYYSSDFKSIYKNIGDDERESKIIEDVFTDKKWKPDKVVKEACAKYKELNFTQSMGLLEDAESAVEKLRTYFRDVNLMETDNNGKPIYSAKDLIANLKQVGDVISGIKKLKEEVAREITSGFNIKGGGEVGMREEPREEIN